jgi:tryptophan halogenase
MIKRIIVLGGGSAGFLAALGLKRKLRDVEVVVIRSKDIGIIGVGEGSTLALTRFLHDFLGVNFRKFFTVAQPTWKLGLRLVNWGPRPYFNYGFSSVQLTGVPMGLERMKAFYCWNEMEYEDPISSLMTQDRAFQKTPGGEPALHPGIAYHIENERFVQFLEEYATALGVAIVEDKVLEVEQDEKGVSALKMESGQRQTADLYVDASGFVSLLLGKTFGEPFLSFNRSLFVDRAVVGGWNRKDPEDMIIRPYTACETMTSGWCWQIEHENRINRGYVFSSAFISDEEAEKEFRAKNPKVGPTRFVRFISGRYQNLWVKNVVAVGNSAGFVEPLEATALGAIGTQVHLLASTLAECGCVPTPSIQRVFNRHRARSWDDIRDFLSIHYKFNTLLDTPFWRHCREATDLAGAAEFVEYYQQNGPSIWLEDLLDRSTQFGSAGYLALLLGQKVQHHRPMEPSAAEMKKWNDERSKYKNLAMGGLTIRETIAALRSPKWNWQRPAMALN